MRIYASVSVDARRRNRIGMLVTKRYRNTYTRANWRAITLDDDVRVQLMCEYVCILLYTSVHPDDTYLWWNVCWVAECVQLNSGTENDEGGKGFICKANGATWL